MEVILTVMEKDRKGAAGLLLAGIAALVLLCILVVATGPRINPAEPDPDVSTSTPADPAPDPDENAMPDLTGLPAQDAVSELRGLVASEQVTLKRVSNGAVILFADGFVVERQEPEAGTKVDRDIQVVLWCVSEEEMTERRFH